MEKSVRYTLGKEERLKSRKAIELLFKEGKAFSAFPLRVMYHQRNTTMPPGVHLQAGFTVSTRYFKNATDRNRMRRLLKEAYRLQKHQLESNLEESNKALDVFFIYVGKELWEYALICEKMHTTLQRLIQIMK